ncbi:uncharacterized protein LOC136082932 [Hydra vulgaris]|uniref:Uncharacterized protein LOC136082932 n=1 Tax=Hydra vulgaris TaxID=6087 RepID=A0ABM4C9S6_HYDVU
MRNIEKGSSTSVKVVEWPLPCADKCSCFSKDSEQTLRLNAIDIDPVSNPHLDLCICNLCNNIMYKPLILKECHHSFCSVCIFKKIEGKLETETKCFICNQHIPLFTIVNSVNVTQLIERIILGCNKQCKLKFAGKDNELEKLHKEICIGDQLLLTPISKKNHVGLDRTLSDEFLLKDNDNIPRIVEDAALHVIKQKLVTSESNFIAFPEIQRGLRC